MSLSVGIVKVSGVPSTRVKKAPVAGESGVVSALIASAMVWEALPLLSLTE